MTGLTDFWIFVNFVNAGSLEVSGRYPVLAGAKEKGQEYKLYMKLELIATATFGLEAVVKREIQDLGYKILKSEDGKITYLGDERAIVRSNLWLRSADRVLLKMAEFKAMEFEELFQQTRGIPWEELIPIDGRFTVTGTSVKSKLHSVPACQSIVKKAVVERLREYYFVEQFEGRIHH